MTQKYDESAIDILDGLEPVRLRPGQFTRTDSPLHIVQEVLDNSVDEALGGHASSIQVELFEDGTVSVADNGRGIPVGLHKKEKIPVVQAVFGKLYAGGKFKKGEGAYSFSGGLHGVGVSVTNALSETLRAEVAREGALWAIEFQNGELSVPLKKIGKAPGTGTRVVFKPNPKYFDKPTVAEAELRDLLITKAVLLPGLRIVFKTPASGETVFEYKDGMSDFLSEINAQQGITPVISGGHRFEEGDEQGFAAGEGADWALQWTDGAGAGRSFVNLIPTPEHGTHVSGLRNAALVAVREFAEHHSMMPKGIKLSAEDVCKGLSFVLSVRMLDPSFDNQTKDRLNSRDGARLVERAAAPRLQGWMNLNPDTARLIAETSIRNAAARARAAQKVERKRSSSVVLLPGKLADCESSDTSVNELFLVEGDSAGGSAKMARNKDNQAILPLRGKSLNVWEKTAGEALGNEEIADIAQAIGLEPGSSDLSKLRYGKIAILSDADVDGFHIQVLLLTLFFRHFPAAVEKGLVYIAKPPLYRLDVESAGKKRPARKLYAMDAEEMNSLEKRLANEGYSNWKVGRFKGLGEMDPEELWETTLNPDTRRLLPVRVPQGQNEAAMSVFENLMGKSQAAWRRSWMERRGHEIESD